MSVDERPSRFKPRTSQFAKDIFALNEGVLIDAGLSEAERLVAAQHGANMQAEAVQLEVGLQALATCGGLLYRAEREGRIRLRPDVTPRLLELMALQMMRVAHTKKSRRGELFQNWSLHGPAMIEELIEKVEQSEGKVLHPNELTMFLSCCPPDGD